jgi:RimJ/RimL family protein N-acetyltransferase
VEDAASRAPTAASLLRLFGDVRTERLVLSRPRAADGAAMFRIHGDPETQRYNPFGPDPDQAASEKALRAWLRQWADEGTGYWAVRRSRDAEVIGFGGVRGMVWRERAILNLYYRFTPRAWGQGYASEMARAAVGLARAHLPALPIVARVRAENLASIKTAERAGLERRPDLGAEEHLVFALGWPDAML